MRRKIFTLIAVIVLLAGLAFLLFPPISNFVGRQKAESAAQSFDRSVSNVAETVTAEDGTVIETAEQAIELGYPVNEDGWVINTFVSEDDENYGEPVIFKKDLDDLYADSLAYNKMLLTGQGTADTTQYDREALDITEYGLCDYSFGYITAETIDLRLPIFLGASEDMMRYGAGHLYGTSLPIGSESENCALAGHTDYIGRIFFDNIRKLELGDVVSVTNYWDTIDYKVIDFKTVKPDDASYLMIQKGRRLLTLITCVSDGDGGFDRFLVICEADYNSDSEK